MIVRQCTYLPKSVCPSTNGRNIFDWKQYPTNITIFTTNKCEKCPSSIQYWDSNTWPSVHECPPITTRPGLPPINSLCFHCNLRCKKLKYFICIAWDNQIKIIVSALIVSPLSTRDPKITSSLWQSLLTDRFTDDNYEKEARNGQT